MASTQLTIKVDTLQLAEELRPLVAWANAGKAAKAYMMTLDRMVGDMGAYQAAIAAIDEAEKTEGA